MQRSRLYIYMYIYKISKFHIHCIYTYIQVIFKFHIQCIYTVYIAVYIAKYIYTLFCIYDIYQKVYISYIHIDTQGWINVRVASLSQLLVNELSKTKIRERAVEIVNRQESHDFNRQPEKKNEGLKLESCYHVAKFVKLAMRKRPQQS